MLPVQVSRRAFLIGFSAALVLAALYPLVASIELPRDQFWKLLRHDVTWSVYCLAAVPVGFGLLASVFELDVLKRIPLAFRLVFGPLFVGLFGVFVVAIVQDAGGIPTPDRIAAGEVRERAFFVDSCLRNTGCGDLESLKPSTVCMERNAERYHLPAGLPIGQWHENPIVLKHAYACALELSAGSPPHLVKKSKLSTVALGLNVLLILYIWSFIWMSGIYFLFGYKDIGKGVLPVLVGCLAILITWFPLRAYADWYQWYGDLSHLLWYDAFMVLAAYAIGLVVFYAVWLWRERTGMDAANAITAAYSVLMVVVGSISGLKPEVADAAFRIVASMPWPFFVALLSQAVLAIGIYALVLVRRD